MKSLTADPVETLATGRGPLFRAVRQAAREGLSRRSFAVRTGLTSAEVMMVERAMGVHLAD